MLATSLTRPELQVYVMGALPAVIGAEACAPLRQSIMDKLTDKDHDVRQAAVEALTGVLSSDAAIRQALLAQLND